MTFAGSGVQGLPGERPRLARMRQSPAPASRVVKPHHGFRFEEAYLSFRRPWARMSGRKSRR